MVKALDAVAAHRAVPATARSDSVTIGAQLRAINHVKHVHELNAIILDVSRLHARSQRKEKERQSEEAQVHDSGPKPNIYISGNISRHR